AVLNAYLVRSMPYPHADRLYHVVYAPAGQLEPRGLTALDWRALADVVDVADYSAPARFRLTGGGFTQEVVGLAAAPGAMDLLGVTVVAGRALEPVDYQASSEPVALIGHSLWRDRFSADPEVV